jgi:molecular chaperone GrpE
MNASAGDAVAGQGDDRSPTGPSAATGSAERATDERQAGNSITDDAATLTQELAQARQLAAANQDRYLRVHAEMENYKKRIERTYAELSRNSKKDLLLKLLGVKDNLERALSYGGASQQGENESIIQGVRLTEYQLDGVLRAEGVTPIELTGQPFNPHEAEALSTVVDPSVEDHTVVQEVQKGYRYQDDVLRPAKVIVAVRQSDEQA